MTTSPSRLCRLCLERRDDTVNIFDNFQKSTIASILTQHFWFEVSKDDGLSDTICQICWINTKTFHNFYKRVEFRQKNYWNSVNASSVVTNGSHLIKQERGDSPASVPDLNLVKYEVTEEPVQATDFQIVEEESFDHSDDYSCDQGETLPLTGIDCERSSKKDDLNEPHQSSNLPPTTKKDKTKEDAQIREYFSMVCEICREQFQTFTQAKTHYRHVHNTSGYLICCGRRYHRRGAALNHIFYHLNPDAYRCDICNKRFGEKNALKNHMRNHEPSSSRAYKCDLCRSSFITEIRLLHHKRLQHCAEEDKKFHCDKCSKSFLSKSMLAYHIRGDHELAFSQVCDICARVFKTKNILRAHMKGTHSAPQPKVQCNVCGVWLKHELGLKKHLQRHHDTTANCQTCNKVLQNKASLSAHIRRVHGESRRRHQCTICEKTFKEPVILKEHMAIHTGEDLYNCPYCTKTFKSGANMCSHRKKAHFDEWSRDNINKRIIVKQIPTTEWKLQEDKVVSV